MGKVEHRYIVCMAHPDETASTEEWHICWATSKRKAIAAAQSEYPDLYVWTATKERRGPSAEPYGCCRAVYTDDHPWITAPSAQGIEQ